MNYYLFSALILFSLGGIFSLQRQIQMFQQNSYYPTRYLKWLKTSKSSATYISAIFLVLSLSLNVNSIYLPIVAAVELVVRIYKCTKYRKNSIKKLVYTPRVKRLIATCSVLFVIFSALALIPFFNEPLRHIFALITIFLSHFPWFIMMVGYFINQPIEKSVSKHFVNDAKKILRQNKNLKVIGVTGSFGKTSVKFMLGRILSEKFNTLVTPESFNTPMGVVRTIRSSLNPSTEIFVAEMGAKNIGDIKELCDIVNPTLGIITAVGPQHLETFKTIENIANTKFELADACIKNGGTVYANFDSEDAKTKAKSSAEYANIISYGSSDALSTATNIKMTESGTQFDVNYKNHKFSLTTKLLGKHNLINLLGAATLALDLGVDEKQIRYAVSTINAPAHRLELKSFINGSLLIDDAYNSNPVGSLEAVNVLASFDGKKKILVTPGLVELGEKEYECNFALGAKAAENCDIVILVGKNRAIPMKDAIEKTDFKKENLYIANSFADAMKILQGITDKNTVVLFENDLPDNYAG